MLHQRCLSLFAILALALTNGCGPTGPDLGPFGLVSGSVTYQGQAVSEGMITFHSLQSGQVATAEFSADGSYRMQLDDRDGLPVGEYMISIRPPLTVQSSADPSKQRRNSLYDPSVSKDIPMKYRYESSSGFTATVVEGDNTFDFNMTAK